MLSRAGPLGAVLLPFLWLAAIRIVSLPPGADDSSDAYYHVALADGGLGTFAARTFPRASLSVWNDAFSDKELGFHLLLVPLRRLESLLEDPGPPFHVPALAFLLLFLVSFAVTLRVLQIRDRLLLTCLLVLASPLFTGRLLVLRPHLLAMTLVVLSCGAFARVQSVRGTWLLAALGFCMSWCYSNSHFLLGPALVFAAVRFPSLGTTAALLPLMTLAGLVAGFIVHPQFPATFVNWKIQSIDSVIASVLTGVPLNFGREMQPPSPGLTASNSGLLVLAAANLYGAVRLLRARGWPHLGHASRALLALCLIGITGFFLVLRSIEYAVPFTVLAAGALLADLRRAEAAVVPGVPPRALRVLAWLALAAALPLVGLVHVRIERASLIRPLPFFAAWAGPRIPPGTLIANLHWSDFPLLLYSAPHYRYLYGLDPMFGYRKDPATTARIEGFATRRDWMTPGELARLTGARYAFVSAYGWGLAGPMLRSGYQAVYGGPDGWLFRLPEPAAARIGAAAPDNP